LISGNSEINGAGMIAPHEEVNVANRNKAWRRLRHP
jgi:hypothetical protein